MNDESNPTDLAERSDADASSPDYELRVSDDRQSASLRIHARGRSSRLEVRSVLRELERDHHLREVDEDALVHAITAATLAEPGDELPEVVVARGRPPERGHDGELVWLGEFFESHAITLPDGSVDHYHHTRRSVYEGQPLLEIRPPTPGRPGVDVLGEELPAPAGQPATLQLQEGARFAPDRDDLVIASRGGTVEFSDGRLGVSELLEVEDVDYGVGSIDFDGSVRVLGNVAARFGVRGGASVSITGTVENVEVESDGRVQIEGAVMGRGEALLVSGGDMLLASARETEIQCGGRLVVQHELLGCEGEVQEDLVLEKGRLVGGHWRVGAQVLLSELGSREEVRTRIDLGESAESSRALRRLHRARQRSYERLQEFSRRHAYDLRQAEKSGTKEPGLESIARRLAALRAEARRARRRELVARRRLRRRRMQSRLLIHGTVFPGVRLAFARGQKVFDVQEEIQGPVTILYDEESDEIQVLRRR